ncbi:MAG: hypothetical protein ABSB28_11210 [Candidatus Bathyarchaeia archaeon]
MSSQKRVFGRYRHLLGGRIQPLALFNEHTAIFEPAFVFGDLDPVNLGSRVKAWFSRLARFLDVNGRF